MVIDEAGRLNVISFDVCVLAQLRDRVRSKEILGLRGPTVTATRIKIFLPISTDGAPPTMPIWG